MTPEEKRRMEASKAKALEKLKQKNRQQVGENPGSAAISYSDVDANTKLSSSGSRTRQSITTSPQTRNQGSVIISPTEDQRKRAEENKKAALLKLQNKSKKSQQTENSNEKSHVRVKTGLIPQTLRMANQTSSLATTCSGEKKSAQKNPLDGVKNPDPQTGSTKTIIDIINSNHKSTAMPTSSNSLKSSVRDHQKKDLIEEKKKAALNKRECVRLDRELSREGVSTEEQTDLLHLMDQALQRLSRECQGHLQPSLLCHLAGQFLLHCGTLLVMRERQEDSGSNFRLVNILYMAAWTAQVCLETDNMAEAGRARKVVAGHMVLALLKAGRARREEDQEIPESQETDLSDGEKIFQAVFLTSEPRDLSGTSWLCGQQTILNTHSDLPSMDELTSLAPSYLRLYSGELSKMAWLLLQHHSPDQELLIPFSVPWENYQNPTENISAEDFSLFLKDVVQRLAWESEPTALPPALLRVRKEQEDWWKVATLALTGSLQTEERDILRRGLERLRVGDGHTDNTLTHLVRTVRDRTHTDIVWVGDGVSVENKTYYQTVILKRDAEFTLTAGDAILVMPQNRRKLMSIARVSYLVDGPAGAEAHVVWYRRPSETVLKETGDRSQLFQVTECDNVPLDSVWNKCTVEVLPEPKQSAWRQEGGGDTQGGQMTDGLNFWCRQHYHRTGQKRPEARFEYFSIPDCPGDQEKLMFCWSCLVKEEEKGRFNPRTGETDESGDVVSVTWDRAPLRVGDSVYIDPKCVGFKYKKIETEGGEITGKKEVKKTPQKSMPKSKNKEANENNRDIRTVFQKEPFKVGTIKKILKRSSGFSLRVCLYYRPEDTHEGSAAAETAFFNQLYHSEEEAEVSLNKVQGRCYVRFLNESVTEEEQERWREAGPDRWFFRETFRAETAEYVECPPSAQRMTNSEFPLHPPVLTKLRGLDIFSGCGGLSEGLHQSGVVTSKWSIEKDEQAAKAYQLNNPDCVVFCEDCNMVLSHAMKGLAVTDKGQIIPRLGEVDLICGGPPCQGYSAMNSNKESEKSQRNNSQVFTFLSYCDFYRPRFFIFENVMKFAEYEEGKLLKKYMSALVQMGYQCTFSVLQAAHYGVPQSRRRLIILAAAPGEKLPLYPEPRHVFYKAELPLSVNIDGDKYESNSRWKNSAPYRTVIMKDAIRDLPRVDNDHNLLDMSYDQVPMSHFQKKIREGSEKLRDHIPTKLNPVNLERVKLIPKGCDVQALPDTMKPSYLIDKPRPGAYGRPHWGGMSKTVTTKDNPGGRQGEVIHCSQNRTNTVRENARIQGFQDSYQFVGSHAARRRQVGNAVPPPLGEALGRQIRAVLSPSEELEISNDRGVHMSKRAVDKIRENDAEKRKTTMGDYYKIKKVKKTQGSQ